MNNEQRAEGTPSGNKEKLKVGKTPFHKDN
jgi:hypothetical protein